MFLHVGLAAYSFTSFPCMVWLLWMNEEEVKVLKKKLEAIEKNVFRGFEEKKQSTWTIWIEGEKDQRLVHSFKKVTVGAGVPMSWMAKGQIWCQNNMD